MCEGVPDNAVLTLVLSVTPSFYNDLQSSFPKMLVTEIH